MLTSMPPQKAKCNCKIPKPKQEPVGFNGLTESETFATMSVAGLSEPEQEPWDTSDMAHRSGGLSVEQEPVACVCKEITTLGVVHRLNAPCFHYTAPPKREWVGLTVQDYHDFLKLSGFDAFKAIEAKLKERNT